MNRTKTILIPCCARLTASTDGTTTPVYYDLDVPEFRLILPYADGLTLYSLTEGAPANNEFEWNLVFRSGHDRHHETADINKIGPTAHISTSGSARHSAFTDTTKFLLESRLQISVNNKTGVSGVRSATISAVLAVQTVGM